MTTEINGTLRRTALYDAHLALGARIVPFGGFEMPVQYSSILKEHDAVRSRAGLFDLSHMAQFALTGADVGTWAEGLTVNKVANMKPGQARYNIFTNERGGAHDDVIFYRLDAERWLLVVNAGNADKMWAHVSANAASGVEATNLHGERALIAIQGPRSVEWLQPYVEADLATKEAALGGLHMALEQALAEQFPATRKLLTSHDVKEGPRAFAARLRYHGG